jgi:hypothetical protein
MQRQSLGLLAGYLTKSLHSPYDYSSTQLFDFSFSDKIVSILGDFLHATISRHPDKKSHAATHTEFLQNIRDGVRKWHGQRKRRHDASPQCCACESELRRPRGQPLPAIIRLRGQSTTLRRADALDVPLSKQGNIFNKGSHQIPAYTIVAESDTPFLSLFCFLDLLSFSPRIFSVCLLFRVNDLLPDRMSQMVHKSSIDMMTPSSAGPLTSTEPLRQFRVRSLDANEKANPRALAAKNIISLWDQLSGEDLHQPGTLDFTWFVSPVQWDT